MDTLPLEIYQHVVGRSIEVYRALLSIPAFARKLDVSTRYDFMIQLGFGIVCGKEKIRWTYTSEDGTVYTHRVGGPAIVCGESYKYVVRGKTHRIGGPAKLSWSPEGYTMYWFQDGVKNRDDGPAVMTVGMGLYYEAWYKNDALSREDGPATTYHTPSGFASKSWYVDNKHHRTFLPAVECTTGDEWWYNDVRYFPPVRTRVWKVYYYVLKLYRWLIGGFNG